jgi:hypothetical protein
LTRRKRQATERQNGKMHIVTNPNAGKHTGHAGIGYVIGRILSQPKNPNKLYDTQTLQDLEGVAEQINRDTDPGKIVAIASGDGGVHHVITRVVTRHLDEGLDLPDFAIIPVGTMNMVATAIGCNRIIMPPKGLAERITDKLAAGQPFEYVHCRVMKINGEHGFIFGAGLPIHLLESYYDETSDVRGGPQAAKVVFGSIWRELVAKLTFGRKKDGLMEPLHASVRLPDHDPPCAPLMSHTAILASTIDQLGFGCRAMPDALAIGQREKRFFLRSTGLTYLGAAMVIGQLWAGFSLPDTFDAAVARAEIEFIREPARFIIDGEFKPAAKSVKIEAGPLLRFIVG